MSFICDTCNKTFKSYQSRWNHINKTHKQSPPKIRLSAAPTSAKNLITAPVFTCIFCDKNFTRKDSLTKHHNFNRCKEKKAPGSVENKLQEIEEKHKREMAEHKQEMAELRALLEKTIEIQKIHPKTLKKINNNLANNISGNTNCVINNNVIIPLGKENLCDIMSASEKKAILNENNNCLYELIKLVHISDNEKYSQFKNLYFTNIHDNIAFLYDEDENRFIAVKKSELFDKLVDYRLFDLENFLAKHRHELDPATVNRIERFIQRMDEEGSAFRNERMGKIKLLFYNSKDDILKQIKEQSIKEIKDIEI